MRVKRKRCSKCKRNYRKTAHSWCRPCLREDQAVRRKVNPRRAKRLAKAFRTKLYKKFRAYVNKIKEAPCTDCKQTFPPCVMEFDHLDPSKKTNNIATLMRHAISLKRLQEEIDKCELVCSNCHRIRTWITRKQK